ncbi:hypothetical protein VP01_2574g2 [Puccinia sorghi]|uniref:Uncharacterized protein n=1 Tax=Puccinia sorghi TaxID=27349 RepID=A0A0L6V506_9BASI|nr:hypothetical protein VP01_2574g2 [Puccinia sorghi]
MEILSLMNLSVNLVLEDIQKLFEVQKQIDKFVSLMISLILDSNSYSIIYCYFHGAWSNTRFEGTLFIFQCDSFYLGGLEPGCC